MKFKRITSPANPKIREAISLLTSRRSGSSGELFLIEGPHLIESAISAGASIRTVFFSEAALAQTTIMDIALSLGRKHITCFETTGALIRKISGTETPQGIVAVASFSKPPLKDITHGPLPLLVLLDGIQDPGNLGSIIRTADAAGADGVVLLPGTCDAYAPKTIRATAGSIFNIPVITAETESVLSSLKQQRISVVATAADAGQSLFDARLDGPIAFAFGNEAHGVSRPLRSRADSLLRIPIQGSAESLNVASAAAVCLYEAIRQRDLKKHPS